MSEETKEEKPVFYITYTEKLLLGLICEKMEMIVHSNLSDKLKIKNINITINEVKSEKLKELMPILKRNMLIEMQKPDLEIKHDLMRWPINGFDFVNS